MHNVPVTVIVPVYNLQRYIGEALESLRVQTFADFEAIVIDDGSSDGSASVIKHYLDDPRFTYVYKRNGGAASARNAGLELAKAEWCALLDGDDAWLPSKLGVQMSLADSDARANVVYTNAVMVLEDGSYYGPYCQSGMPEGEITRQLYLANCLLASSTMVKTADLRAVGGFPDQRLCEDYDTWLRLAHRGIWVRACEDQLVRYRIRAGSQVSAGTDNLEALLQTLQHALEREQRPALRRILRRRIREIGPCLAYEHARSSARTDSRDMERGLWESWRLKPENLKRLLLAGACTACRLSGCKAGLGAIIGRLRANGSPWERL